MTARATARAMAGARLFGRRRLSARAARGGQAGFTLLEVMAAFAVLALTLVT